MLYHSDEAAFEYIKNKRKYPDGALHLRYGNRFRKAYREGEGGDGGVGGQRMTLTATAASSAANSSSSFPAFGR